MSSTAVGNAIKERAASPHYRGPASVHQATASGVNPFCGDQLELGVSIAEGPDGVIIENASFDGYACSLCLASADALLEKAIGMATVQAELIEAQDLIEMLGGAKVGRTRMGCVTLPLRLLREAIASAAGHH